MESNLTNKPTAANSFAAGLTAKLDADHAKWQSAHIDHAEFASQMETQYGGNKFVSRRQYRIKNIVNGAYVEMYGNEPIPPHIAQQKDKNAQLRMYMRWLEQLPLQDKYGNEKNTRFCARLNLAYHEQRRAAFLKDNPHCDKRHDEYNSVAAAENMTWNNIKVDHAEALKNFNEILAWYTMWKNYFEHLTGEEYLFQPWTVTDKTSTARSANARLAALIADAA